MPRPIAIVDAFTDTPFSGNPAAVCLLDEPAPADWMQAVAAEMNLSETAFVHPLGDGAGFGLRWFTPATEVDLCGHATLATAHLLWEAGRLGRDAEARFETRSGWLTARSAGDTIEMDFPSRPVRQADAPSALIEGLAIEPSWVGRDAVNWLVLLSSEGELRGLRPDMARLGTLPEGVIVTSASGDGRYDFVSRYFAPSWGIPEDPVTGSAHCSLGPFWSERLGKDDLTGYQASARGGVVRVRLAGDRAILRGAAVTVMRGKLVDDRRGAV